MPNHPGVRYLFCGSDEGAQRHAVISTVLDNCALAGANPFAYLRDVIAKLAGDWPSARITDLMPAAWAAEVDAGRGPVGALTTAEKEELAHLRKEVKVLRMEREILKLFLGRQRLCAQGRGRTARSRRRRRNRVEKVPSLPRRLRPGTPGCNQARTGTIRRVR
jgi:hypothetical protein